ncbi:PREDICTED: anaphase-promoting complex subunit 2-like isoform X2 [Priapulus caudatus]|nr:PREDICTED: anaphase-promoting complex subunit 2-like isoform X2 [Priapulus caudatus]
MNADLQQRIAPNFLAYFSSSVPEDEIGNFMSKVIAELYDNLSAYIPKLGQLDEISMCISLPTPSSMDGLNTVLYNEKKSRQPAMERAQSIFKAMLLPQYQIPESLYANVQKFYSLTMRVHHTTDEADIKANNEDRDDECIRCTGCCCDTDNCQCQTLLHIFHQVNQQLYELGLLERFAGEAVTSVIHEKIQDYVQHTCKGNFESSYLSCLETWLETKVVGWLSEVYRGSEGCERYNDPNTATSVEAYKSRLYYLLYETYTVVRIDQLFNIIIEYPESEPAIVDLRCCLEKTNLRSQLVTSLKTALETRLLHPGVNTADILTAYISGIRALRVLDPTGVILELVCEPVRKYLRTRDDTVRCIVSSLTDDSSSDLADELVRGEPLLLDDSCQGEEDMANWETWYPDPVDADPTKTSKSRRSSDIISMLVNIYGSKELFVNEYRTLLADRILSQFNYDTEKEIRYLELLKLRFGEAQLHYCEVMLKDVADSKRINSLIHNGELQGHQSMDIPVNAMILSAQFWPTFREDKLELPAGIKSSLDAYTKNFETLKGNRTLCWKPHLGLVSLEIELKDRKVHISCSPVHATIIMHFQEKSKWTVDELSVIMHVPVSVLRHKMAFWQSQGLLKEESADTFILIEEGKGGRHDIHMIDIEEETESAMASSHDQREEELQVFWSYIVGMLTNLETLPLEKIHTMLKVFAMQGPSTGECSIQELKHFLDRKVKEQHLIYAGGVYRLPKPGS